MESKIKSIYDTDFFSLSEEDIKNRYITPALENKGWTKNQTRMEYTIKEKTEFTDGKIISRQGQYGKGFGVAVGGGVGWSHHLGERWLVDIFLSVDKTWTWYNRYEADGDIIMHPQGHEHYLKPDPFNGSTEVMPIKGGISFGYRILKGKK